MEQNNQEEIKAHLMQTNEKYRHLAEQHSQYKKQVSSSKPEPLSLPKRNWKNIV